MPAGLYDFTFTIDPFILDNTSWVYYTPKKENDMSVVTVTKNTADTQARIKRRAERQLKNCTAGTSYATRVEVTAHTYADEPYATLYVQVPGEPGQSDDGQYVAVALNSGDLEAIERELFNARKKVDEASKPKTLTIAEMLAR